MRNKLAKIDRSVDVLCYTSVRNFTTIAFIWKTGSNRYDIFLGVSSITKMKKIIGQDDDE
jgi:hypothetical protein